MKLEKETHKVAPMPIRRVETRSYLVNFSFSILHASRLLNIRTKEDVELNVIMSVTERLAIIRNVDVVYTYLLKQKLQIPLA